jgi:acyl dehydratase
MNSYLKAALPMIPGASKLPFVAGGGGAMPDTTVREAARVDREHLAAYAKVCGFRVRDELPPTYPHVLAFPLHMELITRGDFPFPAVGLVHIENSITQHRPVRLGEELQLEVEASDVEPHPKGKRFSLLTRVSVEDEVAWESRSTMLRRGKGSGDAERQEFESPEATAEWRLPGDLGRRYGAVSGDSNPIHMYPLTAKAFGFDRPIAHGMWTKARALAALRLPDAFTVEVRFKKPIFLPGTVRFGAAEDRFAVQSRKGATHLEGRIS